MRNKRVLWCVVAGVFLLLAGGAIFLVVHVLRDRITPENCDLIQLGMAAEEVEAILGRPPDSVCKMRTGPILERGAGLDQKSWWGEHWSILVDFNSDGRVIAKAASRVEAGPSPTFWEKVRGAFGW